MDKNKLLSMIPKDELLKLMNSPIPYCDLDVAGLLGNISKLNTSEEIIDEIDKFTYNYGGEEILGRIFYYFFEEDSGKYPIIGEIG